MCLECVHRSWHAQISVVTSWIVHVCWSKCQHDDVIKWKHFPRYWPFVRGIHRSPVNFPHKGQWRGALLFSFICVWINDWVNNLEAGDLRRNRARYDVTVMREMNHLFRASIHKAVSSAAAWHWPAKQGYCDWIILTSGHPCQYQFYLFR